MKAKFYLTDVFAESKYTGNQLATFIDCQHISSDEMQQIAREINFSETTFILSEDAKKLTFRVRIFTPLEEVDFAGHPTLGSAFIIKKHILKQDVEEVTLELNAGNIKVQYKNDLLWMRQLPPVFGEQHDVNFMAEMLSISVNDFNNSFSNQEVSTGLPVTIVPLKNLEALKRAKINPTLYKEFEHSVSGRGILAFSPEGYNPQQQLSARFFADCYGIPEDPATGSANGCLAAYLVKYGNSSEVEAIVGQGYEINRPSQLYLKGKHVGDKIEIDVGGRVIPIAEGFWS